MEQDLEAPWHGANRRKPVNWFVPKLENDFAYLE